MFGSLSFDHALLSRNVCSIRMWFAWSVLRGDFWGNAGFQVFCCWFAAISIFFFLFLALAVAGGKLLLGKQKQVFSWM